MWYSGITSCVMISFNIFGHKGNLGVKVEAVVHLPMTFPGLIQQIPCEKLYIGGIPGPFDSTVTSPLSHPCHFMKQVSLQEQLHLTP